MKKCSVSIIILNSILMLEIIIFSSFTKYQLENFLPVYHLSKDSVHFFVESNFYEDEKAKQIIKKIKQIIKDKKVIIINDNISNMGLGVYDTIGRYEQDGNIDGRAIEFQQFNYEIIIRNNSYYKSNDTIEGISGKEYSIVGRYNNEYALNNEHYEYIYNYFIGSSLQGDFYMESENPNIIREIIKTISENGYEVTVYNNINIGLLNKVFIIIQNKTYFITMIGFCFIYINLILYYCSYLSMKLKKPMKIHILYGATKKGLYISYIKRHVLNSMIAIFFGSLLYFILFANTGLMLTKEVLFCSLIFHVIANCFLFTICFFTLKPLRINSLLEG